VGVRTVRLDKEGIVRAGAYISLYGKGTGFFVHHRIMSAVKRVEFVSDRIYMVLRGPWCNIIVLSMDAPSEKKVII